MPPVPRASVAPSATLPGTSPLVQLRDPSSFPQGKHGLVALRPPHLDLRRVFLAGGHGFLCALVSVTCCFQFLTLGGNRTL